MDQEPIRVIGAHEIGERLGHLSRQRVYQITARPDFPEPVATLMQGKIWLASDVDQWISQHRTAPAPAARHRVRPTSRTGH